ncbi:unnamed protein product [Urochloa humidicola]
MAKQRRQAGCDDVPRMMHELDRDPERRDWTKLPPDLAAEIAGRLLGVDLTEYIRFRSVCKPWRQSTEDPRGMLHSRFIPRNWVVLINFLDCYLYRHNNGEEARKFRLLNVATGASLTRVQLPELSGHHAIGYAEGLLVLWNKATPGIRLLNPLTRAVTDLPGFSSVFAEAFTAVMTDTDSAYQIRGFGVIDGVGASSPPAMVVFLDGVGLVPLIACIRLGDPRWALVDTGEIGGVSFSSALSLRGRFYMSTSTGDVLAVELHPEPRLVYVIRHQATTAATRPPTRTTTTASPATRTRPFFEFFLAPSSNDDEHAGMLMVRASRERRQVSVFEVDVGAGKLVPTSTVGVDRAVFVGSSRAVSVSTRLFPSIAANAVYFCVGNRSMEVLFYIVRLDNGRGEPADLPFSHQGQAVGPFVDPWNLDVYLAYSIDAVQVLGI